MPVETPSLFAQVIKDHLELKERNARLASSMPIDRYKVDDPFENHPLFKTEEQARIEETMDGTDPSFDEASFEHALPWPGQQAVEAAVAAAAEPAEESGFWIADRARDFDWGD
jgi:hypothetical protein